MRPILISSTAAARGIPHDQFRLIDVLKIGAVQCIVLHHLAWYGPMSDQVALIAPGLIGWLAEYGRLAVQVFLVCGGFLAARSLHVHTSPTPGHAVARRYLKLVPPFLVALLLSIAAAALAGHWIQHASIPAVPTVTQFLAHALLLQGVLGVPSLSAGAWYVAIDFQLYAMLVVLMWLASLGNGDGRGRSESAHSLRLAMLLGLACVLSLFIFNRMPAWDDWAPYFFGSYGLGALAWWVSRQDRSTRQSGMLWALLMLAVLLALTCEFRSRIALATAVANLLILGHRSHLSIGAFAPRAAAWIDRAAATSYAVFLIHFPVCLLINALFTRFVAPTPALQAIGMLLAWCGSLLAGVLFHHAVEHPLARWVQRGSAASRLAIPHGVRT